MEHPRPYKVEVEEEVARLLESPEDLITEYWELSFPSTLSHLNITKISWKSLWSVRYCTLDPKGVQIGAYYFPFKDLKEVYIRLDGPLMYTAGREELLVLSGSYELRDKDKSHYAYVYETRGHSAVAFCSPYYLGTTEEIALKIKAYHQIALDQAA